MHGQFNKYRTVVGKVAVLRFVLDNAVAVYLCAFSHEDIALSTPVMGQNGSTTAVVTVTNTGKRDGAEVVQLYIRDLVGSITRPVRELKGFEKVFLKAGESKTVSFKITPELLRFYDYDLNHVAEPGDFDVMIGGSSQAEKTARLTLK